MSVVRGVSNPNPNPKQDTDINTSVCTVDSSGTRGHVNRTRVRLMIPSLSRLTVNTEAPRCEWSIEGAQGNQEWNEEWIERTAKKPSQQLEHMTKEFNTLPTDEFYALLPYEAEAYKKDGTLEPITHEPLPAGAGKNDHNTTFRLPFAESASKESDGSYKFRVYDAFSLWEWVKKPGQRNDPYDRTLLFLSDWEDLRNEYSTPERHPTPNPSTFRKPIRHGKWPPNNPNKPYVTPPLTDANINDAVQIAIGDEGGALYVHPEYGPIADWDVSKVTNMAYLFNNASDFNGDLSNWVVTNVTNMDSMFNYCTAFKSDLSRWKVRNVTNMAFLFNGAHVFESDLSDWVVTNVTNMRSMFRGAEVFKSDLSKWVVSNVTNMDSMFANASAFKSDLSNWVVTNVKSMRAMFRRAYAFESDLSNWDVSNVKDMSDMFMSAEAFNSDLRKWVVTNVTEKRDMFYGAVSFTRRLPNGLRTV